MAAVVESLLHREEGTKKPCLKCKWNTQDPTNPDRGQCTVNRYAMGGIWKRWVRDIHNMTCSKFEEGKLSFRDHV
jgi:benzylsuccinate synthase